MTTRFYLIRHGQTMANTEDRLRGWVDVPLDETGREQARKTGRALAGSGIEHVYSSRLSRAMDTGRAVAEAVGCEIAAHEGFMDFNFGAWGGLLRTEVKERWPELYDTYDNKPGDFASPEGESLWDLRDRIVGGLEDVLARQPSGSVAITSHSVTCKILLLYLWGVGPEKYWNLAQENCCVNVFSHGPRGWVVERLNDVSHL